MPCIGTVTEKEEKPLNGVYVNPPSNTAKQEIFDDSDDDLDDLLDDLEVNPDLFKKPEGPKIQEITEKQVITGKRVRRVVNDHALRRRIVILT